MAYRRAVIVLPTLALLATALLALAPSAPAMPDAHADVRLEPVLRNLEAPWDVAFGDDGWVYVTARPGILYGMHGGEAAELLRLSVGGGEGGLLGVAAFEGMLYVYYTDPARGNVVSRYVHGEAGLEYDSTIIEGIPASVYHNGGRIRVGPDSMLYVATGDAGNPGLSQDTSSLAGKILRLNPDGTIPDDNPVPGSPVYAYGLRNPQGMAWDYNGTMFVTDHGPSGFMERAHDEINRIVPYGNYGWPDSVGDRVAPGTVPPLLHSGSDTWAPSGLAFVEDGDVPRWEGMLLYGALRGEHLGVVSPDGSHHSAEFAGELGRIRAPVQHPNGTVYIITSNADGRGSPQPGDDVLLRVVPDPRIPAEYGGFAADLWTLYREGAVSEREVRTALDYLASLASRD